MRVLSQKLMPVHLPGITFLINRSGGIATSFFLFPEAVTYNRFGKEAAQKKKSSIMSRLHILP